MATTKPTKADKKMGKVMHEYKTGTLHSGSKSGPMVTSRKQAIAIAMSEASKAANEANKAKKKPKKA